MLRIRRQGIMMGAAVATIAFGAGRPAVAQTILGAGATFPAPIYQKWFQTYHEAHPSVSFNYQAVGSGAGIAQYKAGTVDFGASDAPLSDADAASMPRPPVHIPTVAGAVVLAYNIRGVGPGLRLTGDIIADIYLGTIKSWDDPRIKKVNPSVNLPAEAITVVHRSDGSGTTYIFTSYLSAVSSEWKSRVGAGKSVSWPTGLGAPQNPGVAGLIRNSSGSIGYVELIYALQSKPTLPYGPVRNRSGNYVLPSLASTVAAAESGAAKMHRDVRVSIVDGSGVNTYPIAGFTYLLVPKQIADAAKGRALLDFLKWAMGDGQKMAEALFYAPLPQSVVSINERALSGVRTAGK